MTSIGLDSKGVVRTCPACGQKNRVPFASLAQETRCGNCKSPLPSLDSPIEISDQTAFSSLVGSSSLPVLVDFWADWCGPCKMMAPELEKVAVGNAGRVAVGKVNTENLPGLAQQMGISALPTLVLFARGKELGRFPGARPASQIQKILDQHSHAE